jgi:dipeptidyl aminopeptidase/acylaminoacyl peptidase
VDGLQGKLNSQVVWDQSGNTLFVRSPSSSEETTIVRFDRLDRTSLEIYRGPWSPVGLDISPDGRWLAFWRKESSLTILPTEGGEPRQILETDEVNGSNCFVRWSPDGGSLLFPKRRSELWKVDVETGRQQPLGLDTRELLDVSIHPEGERIAFTVKQSGFQVWAMEDFLPE